MRVNHDDNDGDGTKGSVRCMLLIHSFCLAGQATSPLQIDTSPKAWQLKLLVNFQPEEDFSVDHAAVASIATKWRHGDCPTATICAAIPAIRLHMLFG